MTQALLWAAAGTGFTFSMTVIGAAMVFLTKKQSSALMQRIFLGFAAGVMIAASVWSLLIPAIEETEQAGGISWLPAAGGFVLGLAFMLLLDGLLTRLQHSAVRAGNVSSSFRRTAMLVLAVTLHNIPEGMAVGLAFALAADGESLAGAFALALGIGVQNFPEGAAVALPLHQEGFSRAKSFVFGALSGIVEPIFGIVVVLAAAQLTPFMPWLLSAAAGAMLYVVVEELIPEAHLNEHSHPGTLGVMVGFLVMMVLDVALG